MERIRALNGYQKGVLVVMLAMIVVFTILYPITVNRVGYLYNDAILVPSEEDGSTVYSGKISGKPARFTVSADGVVVFQHGDKTYGPYTVTEDPTAVPEDNQNADRMTGIEVRCGDEIIFRGGVRELGEYRHLYDEDGDNQISSAVYFIVDGSTVDEHGNVIDPMEPSIYDILELLEGPELTHKGTWMAWFFGVVLCAVTALSMLFIDELFRWNLQFSIRNVEDAEPSDWEIMGRYFAWTALPVAALVMFLAGLTGV